MKNLTKAAFAGFVLFLTMTACNPNGMNDRHTETTDSTSTEHGSTASSDTVHSADTLKGTGATMGSDGMGAGTGTDSTHK